MSEGIFALIGAILGGLFSYLATERSHKQHLQIAEIERDRAERALIGALRTEIEILWERYMKTMGAPLENVPEGEGLWMSFPLREDYFPIYTSNSSKIGEITNDELRTLTVHVYTMGAAILDSFRMLSRMVEDVDNRLLRDLAIQPQDGRAQKRSIEQQKLRTRVEKYTANMKEAHLELKAVVPKFLQAARDAEKFRSDHKYNPN